MFAKTVLETGYDGPWALEVFNDSLNDSRVEVPLEHATRGIESIEKLLTACGIGSESRRPTPPSTITLRDRMADESTLGRNLNICLEACTFPPSSTPITRDLEDHSTSIPLLSHLVKSKQLLA
ncbi:hypothetical protein Clacol_002896 [Clathrus columnatus]|uniref:Uncharacterized protein n=1 Tax=Clathrus columnatus TaxID=1419009 RepID=A0AAV5A4W1_9AGAM|nr:hypothetical protein Clacol_002896 [Clathrus columnatus]